MCSHEDYLIGCTVTFDWHVIVAFITDDLYHIFLSIAQGTLKPDSAGLISGLAEKASQLKHGTGADDHPVVVVEFDTG